MKKPSGIIMDKTGFKRACNECGSTDVRELTGERGQTHGDWKQQSALSQQLKCLIRGSHNYQTGNLTDSHLDAIEMICIKLSRILTGNPFEPDHWLDIQGYAELGKS